MKYVKETGLRRIYYLSPDDPAPVGGVKQIYRHVNILNRRGFSAFVLHRTKGFRCTWFENNTPVVYDPEIFDMVTPKSVSGRTPPAARHPGLIKKMLFIPGYIAEKKMIASIPITRIDRGDYLVSPEVYGRDISKLERCIKKIIFNQNAHYTFHNYNVDNNVVETPYSDGSVFETIGVSDHTLGYLRYLFPQHPFTRVYYGVDGNIFFYSGHKKRQIAYMPRKLSDVSTQVITSLRAKGVLHGFNIVAIENKTEKETAEMLRESMFFLSFSYREGCALPPMEAMACGCVVIGYDGFGSREYFKDDTCYRVGCSDDMGFIKTMEHVIGEYEKDPAALLEKGRKASKYILKEYSVEREETSIIDFWTGFLKKYG